MPVSVLVDTWKGVSALQLVANSPYTSLRALTLELLLLNLEKPEASSVLTPKNNCVSLSQWARDVARRVVDSRGRSGEFRLSRSSDRLGLIASPLRQLSMLEKSSR